MRKLSAIALLLAPCLVQSADYFIIQGGAGSQNGTSLANACNGLSDNDCNATPPSGSRILLCGNMSIGASWAPNTANTVTFTGDCSEYGYPNMSVISNTGGGYNMNWQGSGNATFTRIRFAGSASSSGFDDCVNIDGSGTVVLDRVIIENCKADGLDIDNTTARVTLTNSIVRNATTYGLFAGNVGAPAFVTVTWNLFDSNGTQGAGTNHDAIGIGDGVGGSEIAFNEIVNQRSETGSGIDLQDSTSPNTVVHFAYGNYIHDCEGGGPGLSSTGSASSLFVGNFVRGCQNAALPKGVTVGARQDYYYNALFGTRSSVVKIATSSTGAAKSVDLRGNLIVGGDASTTILIANDVNGSTFTSDRNFFYSPLASPFKNATTGSGCTSFCDLTQFKVGGYEANSKTGLPPIKGGKDPRSMADLMPVPAGAMWAAGGAGSDPNWKDFMGCPFDRWISNIGPIQLCPAVPAPVRTTRQ